MEERREIRRSSDGRSRQFATPPERISQFAIREFVNSAIRQSLLARGQIRDSRVRQVARVIQRSWGWGVGREASCDDMGKWVRVNSPATTRKG